MRCRLCRTIPLRPIGTYLAVAAAVAAICAFVLVAASGSGLVSAPVAVVPGFLLSTVRRVRYKRVSIPSSRGSDRRSTSIQINR